MTTPAVVDTRRDARVDRLMEVLARDSGVVEVIGSIGAGIADAVSDIDLRWRPVAAAGVATRLPAILARVAPVESIRFDPDSADDPTRRLVFIRFEGWPLFSRVDLEIVGDLAGEDGDGTWSPHESALMNVVGALKAVVRGSDSDIDGLLARGFARIHGDDPGGDQCGRMHALITAAAIGDPGVSRLAERVRSAVDELA